MAFQQGRQSVTVSYPAPINIGAGFSLTPYRMSFYRKQTCNPKRLLSQVKLTERLPSLRKKVTILQI
ncbi:MAG: hypothetical protein QME16_02030 [Planctomycetota bacterium]|nr:hypothetical protein [Planctomycetota bacterium]